MLSINGRGEDFLSGAQLSVHVSQAGDVGDGRAHMPVSGQAPAVHGRAVSSGG